MKPLVAFGLWKWIEEHRQAFEPPVGNKVIWEDSQFTAMVIRGPNARRDFHVDPSDEIFFMLKGDMTLEYLEHGRRRTAVIPGRGDAPGPGPDPARGDVGLVVEIKRTGAESESLVWFCERCDTKLHEVTMHAADIEKDLKHAIERFDTSRELRRCRACGHVQPDRAPVPSSP
jgi:3-hydroxyanthranilate 3,4-dioxygenase